jgi:hypothetical protein
MSARLDGLPRTGAVVYLVVDLRSATGVDDARIDEVASIALEIQGADGSC